MGVLSPPRIWLAPQNFPGHILYFVLKINKITFCKEFLKFAKIVRFSFFYLFFLHRLLGRIGLDQLQPLTDLISKTRVVIDLSLLPHELVVIRSMARKQLTSCQESRITIDKFLEWFRRMELQIPFSNFYTMLCAALIIGASSATCEATFSTVTRLLTPYRRCMTYQC